MTKPGYCIPTLRSSSYKRTLRIGSVGTEWGGGGVEGGGGGGLQLQGHSEMDVLISIQRHPPSSQNKKLPC